MPGLSYCFQDIHRFGWCRNSVGSSMKVLWRLCSERSGRLFDGRPLNRPREQGRRSPWIRIAATNDNGPQPRQLSIRTSHPGSMFIEIAVQGAGPDIPTDMQDHVFDPFFTTKPDGLRMGLSISRSIVNDHGGQLWCAPSSERGTIFRFTLPIEAQVAN